MRRAAAHAKSSRFMPQMYKIYSTTKQSGNYFDFKHPVKYVQTSFKRRSNKEK